MDTVRGFFLVFTKVYGRMKAFLLCLLLLPIGVLGVITLVQQEETAGILVGIVREDEGKYSQAILQDLLEEEDVRFQEAEDEEALYQGVQDGTYTLGYLFEEDFSEELLELDVKHTVRLVKLENDIYYKYVNQRVFASILEQATPYLAQETLEDWGIFTDVTELEASIDQYTMSEQAFTIDLIYGDGQQEEIVDTLVPKLVRGVICLFLFLCSVISIFFVAGIQGRGIPFAPHLSRVQVVVYTTLPIYLFGFLAAALSLGLASVVGGVDMNLLPSLGLLLLYQVSLLLAVVALWSHVPQNIVLILTPFLVLGILLSHPILLDITLFFPQVAPLLRLLPTYQYLAWGSEVVPYWIGTTLGYLVLIRVSWHKPYKKNGGQSSV